MFHRPTDDADRNIHDADLAALFVQLLDDNLEARIKREANVPDGAAPSESQYERAIPTDTELVAIVGYIDWTTAESGPTDHYRP